MQMSSMEITKWKAYFKVKNEMRKQDTQLADSHGRLGRLR